MHYIRQIKLLISLDVQAYPSRGVHVKNENKKSGNQYTRSKSVRMSKRSHLAATHYETMPMPHTAIFQGFENGNFQLIFFSDNFHIFAQNVDCGYTLEPPQ